MEEYISPKEMENIRIVESSTAGRKMLEKTAKTTNTRLVYARAVLLFKEFMGKELDDIVAEYQTDVKANQYQAFEKWEEILEDFGRWLEKRVKGTTPTTYFQPAKNLINANVPRSLRIQVKSPEPHPREIPPITIEDLRKLRKITDVREAAFIDVLKDSGVSRDDAVELNYVQVKKAVEDASITYLPLRMYRAKEQVEYTTWIGVNAVESLRLFFDIRKRKGEQITDETPVFASDMKPYERLTPGALSQILTRLQYKTGIKVSTHRLRKFFETYVTAGGVHPIVAKYWMGHKIKTGRDIEARYIIPPENLQQEQYAKAYPYIDMRETKESEDLLMAEIKARMESLPPNARRKFASELKAIYREKAARFLETDEIKKLLQAQITDGGIAYSEEFQQINEKELLTYLRNGWQLVHRLNSGEVIVKR